MFKPMQNDIKTCKNAGMLKAVSAVNGALFGQFIAFGKCGAVFKPGRGLTLCIFIIK